MRTKRNNILSIVPPLRHYTLLSSKNVDDHDNGDDGDDNIDDHRNAPWARARACCMP